MSDTLLEAFKTAAETPGKDENGNDLYIAAVLNFINENAAPLLVGAHGQYFDDMPAGGGRQKAIAIGLKEIKTLFDDFTDFDKFLAALDHQIMVEHAKFEIIEAVKNADDVGEMKLALELIDSLNTHRQDLIEEWSNSTDPDAQARAAALEAEEYTVVLKRIASDLNTGDYLDRLAAKMIEEREASGPFYGVGTLVAALDRADVELESPEAEPTQNVTTDEDNAITQAIGATDPNEDPLTYSIKDGFGPLKGTVTFADGAFTYTPADNENGTDTFTIVISDGKRSTEQVVTVAITPVNDAPVSSSTGNSASGDEDTTITGSVPAGTDPEGGTLTYVLVGEPVAGLTFNEDGSFSYVPAANFNGEVTFQYKIVDDGEQESEVQTFTINVTPVNDAPVAAQTGNSASGNEDTTIGGELPDATDVDGDDLTYELVEPVAGLTLNPDGTFSYVPPADFNGTVTFEYRAVDEHGAKSEPQTFTLTVNAVNDAPRDISLSKSSITENAATGTEVGKLSATDPEGGTFTYTLLDNADGRFVLDATTNTLKVADGTRLDYEQAKSHKVKVQVKDEAGATYEETLTIDLTDVASENVTGSTGTDVLVGGTGKDMLNGGLGDDKLSGGLGNDVLTGGKGKDIFVFDSKLGTASTDRKVNFDTIKDFSVKDDSLYLDNAIFKKLGAGTEAKPKQLSKSFFTIGDSAKDKNDYIVYNDKTGVLSYDADGSGRGKAVEFAQLSKKLTTLSHKDFFVI